MKHPIGLVVCYTYFVVVSISFTYATPFSVPFQLAFIVNKGFLFALHFLPPSVLDFLVVLTTFPIL